MKPKITIEEPRSFYPTSWPGRLRLTRSEHKAILAGRTPDDTWIASCQPERWLSAPAFALLKAVLAWGVDHRCRFEVTAIKVDGGTSQVSITAVGLPNELPGARSIRDAQGTLWSWGGTDATDGTVYLRCQRRRTTLGIGFTVTDRTRAHLPAPS